MCGYTRTDNPWPELQGSQNYRWDKSCVNIWNKVKTQRDRFLLVWLPRRAVRRKGFIGITFERWSTVVSCLETTRLTTVFCTGWICLSPFDSLLYPPGHLCLLPPSPILCITSWTSLSSPDCGVHRRKWLPASMLSPLLIPLHLIRVTSNPLLPLLFSM